MKKVEIRECCSCGVTEDETRIIEVSTGLFDDYEYYCEPCYESTIGYDY